MIVGRIFAAIFGAVLFGILVPLAWPSIFGGYPFDSVNGILATIIGGVAFGALLGALFPKPFVFVLELFLDN
jgi:hypothetical protein